MQKDDPFYIELAIKSGNFHSSPKKKDSFSVHLCVEQKANKCLTKIKELFDTTTFNNMLNAKDEEGKSAIEKTISESEKQKTKEIITIFDTTKIFENESVEGTEANMPKYTIKVQKVEDSEECDDDEPIDVYYGSSTGGENV